MLCTNGSISLSPLEFVGWYILRVVMDVAVEGIEEFFRAILAIVRPFRAMLVTSSPLGDATYFSR